LQSVANGVGNNPDSETAVIESGVVRSQHAPFRIEPHLGQIPKNSVKPPKSEHWAVLHKCASWSYLANDPLKFSPESASLPVETVAGSCCADVLARKPSRYHVNNSSPWLSVEGTNIIPNGERWKVSFILSLHESSGAKGVDFHSADGSPSKQFASEYAASSACE
jgi:hypothetical protein